MVMTNEPTMVLFDRKPLFFHWISACSDGVLAMSGKGSRRRYYSEEWPKCALNKDAA